MSNYISKVTIPGQSGNTSYDVREIFPHVGTCADSAATATKTVTIGNFKLYTGAWVVVKFMYTNTAATNALLLNVDNTGAKAIKYKNANLESPDQLAANKYVYFMYDGTYYQIIDAMGFLPLSGGTLTGRVTTTKPINDIITGTGTAAQDKGSGVSPRYFPAKWTYNTGMTATNGDIITIKTPNSGHDYGVFISIDNGTTYYPISTASTSRLTTHFGTNTYLTLIFRNDGQTNYVYPVAGGDSRVNVSGGCWYVLNYYDSNTYDRTYMQTRIYAGGVGTFQYSLCAINNNQRMESFTTTSGTGTSKAFNTTAKFLYPPVIMYHSSGGNVSNGSVISVSALYEQFPSLDLRYSCNITTSVGFTKYKPVYLECIINSDNTFSVTGNGLTQTLTSGKYYILLGCTYNDSIYQLTLFAQHPVYYYDGTNLSQIQFTAADQTKLAGIAEGATKVESSSTNGKIKINDTDTTVYTHPSGFPVKTVEGFYKFTSDANGHVTAGAAFSAADLPAHNHDDKYVKLVGAGTITSGTLQINGAAASKPLVVRGIDGQDGNGSLDALYLNYNAQKKVYFSGGTYYISDDGSQYNGTSAAAIKDGNGNNIASTYLPKTTYEWNKEISFGSSGYLKIGSFPMYDTNITINIDATTATTYHGTVVIATQNVSTSSMGSQHKVRVYDDPTGTIASSLRVVWTSGSRNYDVYFVPQSYSKNLIHIRALGQYLSNTTDICVSQTGTPPATTEGLEPVNVLSVTTTGEGNAVTSISTNTVGNLVVTKGGSYLPLTGGTLSGRVTTTKALNYILTGTGTAGADKGSGQNPRYVPAKWIFNTGQTPSNGDIIFVKNPVAGHDYGVYISIDNGTTFHPATIRDTARLTTHYGGAGNYTAFIFRSDGSAASMIPLAGNTDGTRVTVTGGTWQGIDYYDSGNTYDRTSMQTRIYAGGVGVFRYSICAMNNAQRMESFTTTGDENGVPTTTKAFNTTAKFMYPPVIMHNYANAVFSSGSVIYNNYLYEQYPSIDLRYSCNITSSAGFAQYKPVYLECILNSDNTFSITSNGLTQTFVPGKYYILLGCMYNTSVYQLALFAQHPMFYYDGTNLCGLPQITQAEKTKLAGIAEDATKVEQSSTNGSIKINGSDTVVYAHPSGFTTKTTTGFYKYTVDSNGHVSAGAALAKADITALGIPGENTDTLVQQSLTTTTNFRPLLFGATSSTNVSDLGADITSKSYVSTNFYVKPSTGALYVSDYYVTAKEHGYYLKDVTGSSYCGLYDNGQNLWLGAKGSDGYHHKGKTFISAGWSGTLPTSAGSLGGYSTAYISVPVYTVASGETTGTWTHTKYEILHAGNFTTTGSGNAITGVSFVNEKLTFTKGSTFLTQHPSIVIDTDTTSSATPAHGGTFTTVDSVTRDSNGHVTKINVKTVTLPNDQNTDTKVNVTLGTTTKAYLLGTSTIPTLTAQAVESIADTGVYLGTTSGELCAGMVTISNSNWAPLSIKRVGTQSAGIKFINNNGDLGYIAMNTVNGPLMRWKTDSSTSYNILDTSSTSFTRTLSSGTKIGTIKIDGTSTDIYCETNTDTKNTAGSTDTSSKIYLIGATSQAANPQTYSDNEVYTTSGVLTTKKTQVGDGACTMEYNTTTQSLDFVFT